MTKYNDFSDLDVTDADAMTDRMHATAERLDAVSLPNAILIAADYADVDVPAFLKKLIAGIAHPKDPPVLDFEERMLRDLIEASQSNYERSIHALLEVITLDEMIGNL